ncbi:hypothetical protein LINPERHAP1_LOCUS20470 [Linum perenne]
MVESGGGGRLDSKVVIFWSNFYAEVVAPRGFSRAGGCLVFRLDALDGEYPDWKRFRKWVARLWGVLEAVEIRAIGDDLWWLCCGSEEEVERVLALNRWKLPGHRLWVKRRGASLKVRLESARRRRLVGEVRRKQGWSGKGGEETDGTGGVFKADKGMAEALMGTEQKKVLVAFFSED